ncbi:EAL domain-containing protein [Cohnella lubricantis]|uniref:EAL domain-containing protein n=1 Tax=Cohnella lubricantis TaxID=2163172 RepID=A0A841TAH9_9BACL|nr:EAL domain-containing protein [Cohnella lubricantis]MBB6677039.1 EAL domain-containing protein [Cohnella lubricantis]MBP2119291.1 diguanylate cyclase (GGDEF)-like protein [Cohnella lubricantis]
MVRFLQPKHLIICFALYISAEYALFPFLSRHPDLILAIETLPYLFSVFALQHLARACHGRYRRRFWMFISWASACYAAAQLSWITYDQLLNIKAPLVSFGDVFWNLQSAIYLFALIYLISNKRGSVQTFRLLFDTMIFVVSAAVMSWEFVLRPNLDYLLAGSGWWGVYTSASYPVSDVAVLGCLFMMHGKAFPKASVLPLFAGFCLYIVADTVYLLQVASNTYRIGNWSDPLYTGMIFTIMVAASYSARVAPEDIDKPVDPRYGSRTRYALTYGSMVALLILMLRRLESYNMGIVFYTSLTVVGLIIIRQVTILLENDRLMGRLQQMLERTRTLAFYDQLSLLPNRRYFEMKAKEALEQAESSKAEHRMLAVLFIDLDRFKNVNDSYGHDAGDSLIHAVTERLTKLAGERHFVARMGGDEFTMLCQEIGSEQELQQLAQEILAEIAKPIRLEPGEFCMSASIGIAVYPRDGTTIACLLKNADTALYKAKALGKNRCVLYTEKFSQDLAAKLVLENELRRAFEQQELMLYYQPQIEAASGRLAGVEALIRWRKQGDVMVSPAEFIPVAEESGLIVPIGEWILRTACLQAKQWMDTGCGPLQMSVNVSPRQFIEANFVDRVASTLQQTGLPPERLVLEITEGIAIAMEDEQETAEKLRELKQLGVRISMDDFGTGYSSLGYLRRFQVDELKIAQTFIFEVPGDSEKASIVQAILAMARTLKLKVIAEGVETEEQYRFLRDEGCDWIQGYFFHKPMTSEEMSRLLTGN